MQFYDKNKNKVQIHQTSQYFNVCMVRWTMVNDVRPSMIVYYLLWKVNLIKTWDGKRFGHLYF